MRLLLRALNYYMWYKDVHYNKLSLEYELREQREQLLNHSFPFTSGLSFSQSIPNN